jgi:hypothetical protein
MDTFAIGMTREKAAELGRALVEIIDKAPVARGPRRREHLPSHFFPTRARWPLPKRNSADTAAPERSKHALAPSADVTGFFAPDQTARRLSAEDLRVFRSTTTSKETFCPSLRLNIPARSAALMCRNTSWVPPSDPTPSWRAAPPGGRSTRHTAPRIPPDHRGSLLRPRPPAGQPSAAWLHGPRPASEMRQRPRRAARAWPALRSRSCDLVLLARTTDRST